MPFIVFTKSIKVYVFLVALYLFLSISLFAQTGTIKGHVYDFMNDEPLPGANIYIKSTEYKTASDMNGKYIIQNIEPGEWELTANYIGYEQQTIEITIDSNETVIADIKLLANSVIVHVDYGIPIILNLKGSL